MCSYPWWLYLLLQYKLSCFYKYVIKAKKQKNKNKQKKNAQEFWEKYNRNISDVFHQDQEDRLAFFVLWFLTPLPPVFFLTCTLYTFILTYLLYTKTLWPSQPIHIFISLMTEPIFHGCSSSACYNPRQVTWVLITLKVCGITHMS